MFRSADKVKCTTVVPIVCAQSEWTIPEFDLLVRLKQNDISHCFRSIQTPDVVWQLSIDSHAYGNTGVYFQLRVKSGWAKLSRNTSVNTKKPAQDRWTDVNVILKITSGQVLYS